MDEGKSKQCIHEIMDCIAMQSLNMHERICIINIAFKMIKEKCKEPLLDMAMEYIVKTIDKSAELQETLGRLEQKLEEEQ